MNINENKNEIMIEMIKVSKQYPPDIKALDNISLSITKGEMFFLIGRSGAGKTTLLKLLSCMEYPSSGLIEIDGVATTKLDPHSLSKIRQRIGVAYQDFKLLLNRTVAENIAISMEVSYKSPSIINKQVKDLLAKLDLTDKHGCIAGDLSRGEQQRITLARAVANSPAIILVDEPTGNLDASTTELVMNLLDKCQRSGATIIIATHDETIYENTNCRIMELKKGIIHSLTGSNI